MQQNFRYFRFYQVLNLGQPHMSQVRFINSFFKLYEDQHRYNIAKAQKRYYMKQIERHLDSKMELDTQSQFTKAELREKIEAIKLRIKQKKEIRDKKTKLLEHMRQSTEGIQQFLKSKDEQMQYQKRLLKEAFFNKLNNKEDEAEMKKKEANADLTHRVFLQRQTRVINDLFDIFFSAECQKFYKPLIKLKVNDRKILNIEKEQDKEKIAIALGHIVQLCIHFGTALQITYSHQMIFNGKRSLIFSKDPSAEGPKPSNKLYFTTRAEHAALTQAIKYLEENLNRVYRGLRYLRQHEGIGFVKDQYGGADSSVGGTPIVDKEEDDHMFYPNRIIRLLHKIADF